MASPSIFISYRIADTLTQAGRLHDALEKEFGEGSVFYDKNSLKAGMKWPDELREKVRGAKVVLVLYRSGKEWLGVDDFGSRRIDNPEDWVRKEVETALADSSKLVIPILCNDAKLPPEKNLPEGIRPLLNCQAKQIREANWEDDLLPLKKVLKEHLKPDPKKNYGQNAGNQGQKPNVSFYAFTCDRDSQFEHFEQLKTGFSPGSLHFFYLYGNELQAHRNFFNRIKNDLDGRYLQTVKTPKPETGAQRVAAFDFGVESESCRDAEHLRIRFVRNLCSAFGLNPLDYQKLTDQNLQNFLLASDKTRDLRAGSFVCIFAHISHWYWDSKHTPDAARWFVNTFCPPVLPPESPTVLFFFAFDFNEDQNPGVRKEVLKAIEQEAQEVVNLPELDMVLKRHIAQWLVKHERYVSVPLRNQLLAQFFTDPEYFMANLEPILKKLIDDYFNAQST